MKPHDVQVRGAGLVGQSLALSLARIGLRVALVPEPASAARGPDVRAYALNAASVALLRGLKVWDALPPHAATAVHDMHIEGDASGAAIDFSSWEQHVDELAWIVDAAVLERELAAAVRFSPHISVVSADAPEAAAPLTAICEGKWSATREAHRVVTDRRPYGHRAIAARVVSDRPHAGVARQWFRSPDVLGLLPFDAPVPASSYAIVWSVPDARADELMALGDTAFTDALMHATGGAVGTLRLASERAAWPLMRAQTGQWCGEGWVLLGDAAHVVHPLAGQGLNLGLADVVALTGVLESRESWRGLGDAKLLRRYARERLVPTRAMVEITDALLHLFAHPAPAVRELRNRGLNLVNRASILKRWLTSRALDS
jgi:2-polyprenyl-6-methoxyphenol hydroxylase-like FAD-dependent oxidoreductase